MAKWKFTAARQQNIKKAQKKSTATYSFTPARARALTKARKVLQRMRKAGMTIRSGEKRLKRMGL